MKYYRRWRPDNSGCFFVGEDGKEVSEAVAKTNLQETSIAPTRVNESHGRKPLEKQLQERDAEIRRLRHVAPGASTSVKEAAATLLGSSEAGAVFANPKIGNKG